MLRESISSPFSSSDAMIPKARIWFPPGLASSEKIAPPFLNNSVRLRNSLLAGYFPARCVVSVMGDEGDEGSDPSSLSSPSCDNPRGAKA